MCQGRMEASAWWHTSPISQIRQGVAGVEGRVQNNKPPIFDRKIIHYVEFDSGLKNEAIRQFFPGTSPCGSW